MSVNWTSTIAVVKRKIILEYKFSLLQWRAFVLSSFPLRVAGTHQSPSSGDALKIFSSHRVRASGAASLVSIRLKDSQESFQSLRRNPKREKINVGAVGIIGTFTRIIKRENPFFMLFSCLFILFFFFAFLSFMFLLFWAIFLSLH